MREPEDLVVALLQLLCESGGVISLAAAARRLSLRRSQLERLILLVGDDPCLGGLGYAVREEKELRATLRLTDKGEALCQQVAAPE